MIRSYKAPRQIAAFTLIEVMVALAIVALSLSAVVASISQMVMAASAMQERTYASWIAQNQISKIRLSNETPESISISVNPRNADRGLTMVRGIVTSA